MKDIELHRQALGHCNQPHHDCGAHQDDKCKHPLGCPQHRHGQCRNLNPSGEANCITTSGLTARQCGGPCSTGKIHFRCQFKSNESDPFHPTYKDTSDRPTPAIPKCGGRASKAQMARRGNCRARRPSRTPQPRASCPPIFPHQALPLAHAESVNIRRMSLHYRPMKGQHGMEGSPTRRSGRPPTGHGTPDPSTQTRLPGSTLGENTLHDILSIVPGGLRHGQHGRLGRRGSARLRIGR